MVPSYTRLLAATLLSAAAVRATVLDIVLPNQECGLAMFDIYGSYAWPGTGYGDYYSQLCTNPQALVSEYASLYTYCQPNEIDSGIQIMSDWCSKYGEVTLVQPSSFVANLTTEAISRLPVYNQGDLAEGSNSTEAWLVSQAWFDAARLSEHWYDYEMRLDAYYTFACFGFWGIVLVFGIAQNVIRKTVEFRSSYVYDDVEGHAIRSGAGAAVSFVDRATAIIRKHILTPSALPPYHQRRFLGCTIPTRAESFVVLSYWTISIVLGFVNYHGQSGNIFAATTAPQIWRYLADRTGTMAYGNLPLLWIFAGRNNIFLWLTGWSFGSFNLFHRHIARIATIQGILHSVGYTAYYFTAGYGSYYYDNFKEKWWSLGVAATVVMSFLVAFSFSVFRRRLYESFLLVHIVLSVLLLVFLYYHTSIFDRSEYNYPFLLTASVLWGLDRFLRLVRQAYTNVHVRSGRGLRTTKATVTFHEAANMLTVDVVPGNARLFPGPGQHYFLYQPIRFFGWENHPFTLAGWSAPQGPGGDLHLQFWIRPCDGWTKALAKQCQARGSPAATIAPTLLLEGPYGAAEPLHTFDQVLLVAGGSGIAGVLPYLLDHVRRTEKAAAAAAAAGTHDRILTRTRHVTLVWADRCEASLRLVAEGPLAALAGRPDMTVSLHWTGSAVSTAIPEVLAATRASSMVASSADVASSPETPREETVAPLSSEKGGMFEDEAAGHKSPWASGFHIQAGRPDVTSTIHKLAMSVHGTDARLAVLFCGPGELADHVRDVVAGHMETSRASIEYFEESFGW